MTWTSRLPLGSRSRPLAALLAICASASYAPYAFGGDVLRVPAEHPTIQAAVDAAQPGDTVLIAPGVHRGSGNRDVRFHGKDLVVRSEDGAQSCAIDCEGTLDVPYRAFVFDSGETRAAKLVGLTITRGSTLPGAIADPFNGGAVLIRDASPTIEDCVFSGNNAGCWGGAVYVSGTLAEPEIRRCMFIDNVSADDGGGFFSWANARPTIVDSVFLRNRAAVQGGAIADFGSRLTLDGVTIVGNQAPFGSGVRSFGMSTMTSSIVWGNTGDLDQVLGAVEVSYSDIEGGFVGVGNIDSDPLFRADGYHLSRFSLCIDAGAAPAGARARRDVDRQLRVTGARMDMGADEAPGALPSVSPR